MSRTTKASRIAALGAALVPPWCLAQEAPAPDVRTEVVVTATRLPRSGLDIPAAIDSVDARAIREDKPQVNLSEAINRVPGIVVQNRQNYAQDLQVSSRGFGGRATFGVRGVRLIADGIPATMPDGQGQAASFDLSTAERIEVLRGPFASLYGNASGGVVQVFTDWAENGEWASQTFEFVTTKALQYVSLAITGVNHKNASYVAFDVE